MGAIVEGKYVVEEELGAGAMGAVVRARHLLRHAPVALKVMSPSLAGRPGMVERFLNEGVAASKIESEHVVQVLDVSKLDSGLPYIVMEFLDGEDLACLIERQARPYVGDPVRAVHFSLQMLRGLDAAHRVGVVHRDMKPDNCLVIERDGDRDFIKIVDFGISKVEGLALTHAGGALGTPLYMSLEQARNPKDVDARTDLYAVAVILYELLGGAPPFVPASGSFGDLVAMLAAVRPRPLTSLRDDLPSGLWQVVERGLDRDRDRRFRSADEMARALAPFADTRSERLLAKLRSAVVSVDAVGDSGTQPMSSPADELDGGRRSSRHGLGVSLRGREVELDELAHGLEELLRGRGSLYLVTGEPGIGKTRLADELGRTASARGVAVHWGRAWEAGGAPPYWPFIQLLRSISRSLGSEALAEVVGARAADLADLLPELRRDGIERPIDRFRLFDAVWALIVGAAARAPLCLVLDDLHAADPSTLTLLHFLVRDLRATPLLWIGTFRDVEARLIPEVGRTLAQVAREATVLPLRRLERHEVAGMVARSLGAQPSGEQVAQIFERTEGNPLFVRELLQLLGPQASTAPQIPEGIRHIVEARLALLKSERHLLEAAAVLGREVRREVLAHMLDTGEADLTERLAPAVAAGILEPFDSSSWRFTHMLLREGLYEALAVDRQRALHAAAASALRDAGADASEAEMAHHLLRAVPVVAVADAADAALSAAGRAMAMFAFEDAGALYDQARRLLDRVAGEERRRYQTLLGLGTARVRVDDHELGRRACLAAAELARTLGDGELFAQAALGAACEHLPWMRNPSLIALLEEALSVLPPGDGSLRARCMVQLAVERQPEPDAQGPIALAREAVAMARRIGDRDTLRFTLSTAGLACMVFGDGDERTSWDTECLALSLAAGDKPSAMRAHLLSNLDCFERGDALASQAHLDAYFALAEDLRVPRTRWMRKALGVWMSLWHGRFAEARQAYEEIVEGLRAGDLAIEGASMWAHRVGWCRAAECYDDAGEIASALRRSFGGTLGSFGSCVAEMLIASLYGRAGDRSRSAAQLALVRAHPSYAEIREPAWLALLVDACHLLGDAELAAELYPLLLPARERFYHLGPIGSFVEPPYARQLGLCAEVLGRHDEAVEHLGCAETRTAEAGLRSHLARARYELAGALIGRRRVGDCERAGALLDDARAIAEALGQHELSPRIDAQRRRADDPAPSAAAVPIAPAPLFTLVREGDYWTIAWMSRELRLRHSRGLDVLAQLVASPGKEMHVLQLVSSPDADRGGAGEMLDAEAVKAYRRRLLDLREELEEAESFADTGRVEKARAEIDQLTQELARAVGLGGRSRRAGDAAERARTAVQKRLRSTIRRIGDDLPELGRHFDHSIRTGLFCGYFPDGRARRA